MGRRQSTPALRIIARNLEAIIYAIIHGHATRKSITFNYNKRRYRLILVEVVSSQNTRTANPYRSPTLRTYSTKKYTPLLDGVYNCFTCNGPAIEHLCLYKSCSIVDRPSS